MIAPLLAGGQSREYMAHWLAEGGYDTMPRLYGDGYVVCGDSAMLFNPLHREGNNLAMASGRMAAETIIAALRRNDGSAASLAEYGEKLTASYVVKDMKKYRKFGGFLYHNKELFNQLPAAAGQAAREMLTVDGVGKKQKQKLILKEIRHQMSIRKRLRLLWQGWRAVK